MFRAPCTLVVALGFLLMATLPAPAQDDEPDDGPVGEKLSKDPDDEDDAAAKPEGGAAPTAKADDGTASPASDNQELKLRGLEERVNELKEKIFRTKARIMQLQETLVSGAIGAGSRSVIIHRNEMGGTFKLLSVQYALDTVPIYKKVDMGGDLDDVEEREIDSRNIVPGNHNIAVQMIFQGEGYGLFSYLKGYKFKVTSSYTFTIEEGKIVTVKVVVFERGGITTKIEDNPTIRYDIKTETLTQERARTLQEKAEETG